MSTRRGKLTPPYFVVASNAKRSRWTNKRFAIRHAHALARLLLPIRKFRPSRSVSVTTSDGRLIHQCHARRGVGARIHIVVEEL